MDMIPFVILLIAPVMIQHVHVKGIDYQKKNRFAMFFFFAVLTFLVMFRHESVGNDTRNYIHYFNNFSRIDWIELSKVSLEFGFSVFNKAVSLFSKEPQFFLAVIGVVVSTMIYPTYKRLCVDTSLTLVLFCTMSTFVMMFSGVRQMLSIAIGFIAYEFTRKKKVFPFIFCILLAMTFHISAFMLVFMYPLYHAKITKKWLSVLVPVLAMAFVFNKQIFSVLAIFLERYTKYESSITSTGAFTMLILFVLFAIFAFLIPDETIMDEETVGLRNFLLLTLVIQMFAPLHFLAMRMGYYYMIFLPLLMPKIIACRKTKWEQIAVLGRHIMVVFFLVYFFVNAYGGGNLNVFPYHFFWENV